MHSFPTFPVFCVPFPRQIFLSLFLNFFFLCFAKCPRNAIIKSMKKHCTSYRQAAVYLACILLLAVLLLLPGCSAMSTASTVADAFMEHMQNRDFSAAYSCLWKRADCVKEETFVSRAQAICDSLGVTAITFPSHELSVEGDRVKFSYTIAYAHGEDFTVENTITLHMLQEEGIYAIEYSDDMLLEGYTPAAASSAPPSRESGARFLQRTRRPLPSIPIRIPSPSPFRRSWMSTAPSMPLPHSPA